MAYYAYILKSLADGDYYYGSAENIEDRLSIHNAGKVRSTKGRRPFILRYAESYASRSEAVQRERFFKSPAGWSWLKGNEII
jgi:putative endonuclease